MIEDRKRPGAKNPRRWEALITWPAACLLAIGVFLSGWGRCSDGVNGTASAAPAAMKRTKSLEDLLKEAGFSYQRAKLPDGQVAGYDVNVVVDGKTTRVRLREKQIIQKPDGTDIWRFSGVAIVKAFDKPQSWSAGVLRKIVSMNDGLAVGRISADPNGIYVGDGFFAPVSAEILAVHLYGLHYLRLQADGELTPVLNAEVSGK
jgi:hypothetical protein